MGAEEIKNLSRKCSVWWREGGGGRRRRRRRGGGGGEEVRVMHRDECVVGGGISSSEGVGDGHAWIHAGACF